MPDFKIDEIVETINLVIVLSDHEEHEGHEDEFTLKYFSFFMVKKFIFCEAIKIKVQRRKNCRPKSVVDRLNGQQATVAFSGMAVRRMMGKLLET